MLPPNSSERMLVNGDKNEANKNPWCACNSIISNPASSAFLAACTNCALICSISSKVISFGIAKFSLNAIGEAEIKFQGVSIGPLPSHGFLVAPFRPECPN